MKGNQNEREPERQENQQAMDAPISFLPAVQSQFNMNSPLHEPLAALHDGDWRVRVNAIRALEQWGTQAPQAALVEALEDEDGSVRAASVHALSMLGEQAPLERLLAALQDTDWHVRETAVLALGNLGARVPEKPLVLALKDSDSMVREAAHLVLHQRHNVVITPVTPEEERKPSLNMSYSIVLEDSYPLEAHADKYGQVSYMDTLRQVERRKKGFLRSSGGIITVCAVLLVVILNVTGWLTFALVQRSSHPVSSIVTIQAMPTTAPNFPSATATPLPPPVTEVHGTPVASIPAGKTIYTFHDQTGYISGVAWSPDGRLLASASADGSLEVWDIITGQRVFRWNEAHLNSIMAVAWSPDGNYIAVSGADEHIADVVADVYVLDAHTTQVVSVGYVKSFVPKASEGHIGAMRTTSGGSWQPFYSIAWSPDSRRIAVAADYGLVHVFDAMTGADLGTPAKSVDVNEGGSMAVSWSRDGRYIAYGLVSQLVIWDTTNGQVQTHPSSLSNALVTSVVWSPNSQSVAASTYQAGTGTIAVDIWNPVTGNDAFYENHAVSTWSPDGSLIAGADINQDVQVWDASRGITLFAYADKVDKVSSVAWSPDGNFIASGDYSGVVNVWRAP